MSVDSGRRSFGVTAVRPGCPGSARPPALATHAAPFCPGVSRLARALPCPPDKGRRGGEHLVWRRLIISKKQRHAPGTRLAGGGC